MSSDYSSSNVSFMPSNNAKNRKKKKKIHSDTEFLTFPNIHSYNNNTGNKAMNSGMISMV